MHTRRPTLLQHALVLAFTLVLPVASAHCLTMRPFAATGEQSGIAVSAPMRADHSCCASGAEPVQGGTPSPASTPDCACFRLPAGTAQPTWSLPAPQSVVTLLTIDALLAPPMHPSLPRAPRWSEPPPVAPAIGGHSLRGPPAQG